VRGVLEGTMNHKQMESYFSKELKPCPFCGKKAHIMAGSTLARVRCRCGARTTWYMSKESIVKAIAKAIRVWNRRK